MNLKYYLRGLGVGIIVTALIMGIATSGRKETLSDSEIKERARALGMTEESTLLADVAASDGQEQEPGETTEGTPGAEPDGVDGAVQELDQNAEGTPGTESDGTDESVQELDETGAQEATPDEAVEATQEPVTDEDPEAAPVKTPDEAIEDTPAPAAEAASEAEEQTKEEDGGSITIQVSSGDGSYTVCQKLEEAGLIESAFDFDMYLYENGYDKRLKIGTFEIPEGADKEQIARILAGIK